MNSDRKLVLLMSAKLFSLIVQLLTIIFFTGCAITTSELKPALDGLPFVKESKPADENGALYVFLPLFSSYLSDEIIEIEVGDIKEPLAFGGYFYHQLPHGKYNLHVRPRSSRSSDLWNKTIEINLESGEEVYLALWTSQFISNQMDFSIVYGANPLLIPTVNQVTRDESVLWEIVPYETAKYEISKCIRSVM
jgi:hypothetical protein